jgi:hypothetical protein
MKPTRYILGDWGTSNSQYLNIFEWDVSRREYIMTKYWSIHEECWITNITRIKHETLEEYIQEVETDHDDAFTKELTEAEFFLEIL